MRAERYALDQIFADLRASAKTSEVVFVASPWGLYGVLRKNRDHRLVVQDENGARHVRTLGAILDSIEKP